MEAIIREAISVALADLGVANVEFVVEHPADLSHGDYASNVALVVAKQLGQAPREVAEQLRAALTDQIEHVESIDVAGPGFINFHLTRSYFTERLERARELAHAWGRNGTWAGKKVLVEYTDPNPFKEFHIGHLFTNVVGESIARLFMMNGADTKRINYQGDVGLHVAHVLWGMQQMGIEADDEFTAQDLGKAYAKGATAYKEDEEVAAEIRTINRHVYERDNKAINALYDAGRGVSLAYFEEIYAALGTSFDAYFFESEAGPIGKELVLAHPDIFPESDGAHVFVGEECGLHTRVFLNKEGLPTYEAKELALAKLKEDEFGDYDHSVISTANEVNEYFKVLLKAMEFIYPELAAKTEHIGHGMVRLADGKMSSRTGNVITAMEFIHEISAAAKEKMVEADSEATDEQLAQDVAIAAIKYTTLKSNITQDTVFDKTQALSFEGNSGPYLQYTHARIISVLEKAAAAGIEPDAAHAPATPYTIEKLLYRFPEVVASALSEREPHQVASFLIELASEYNTFYAHERIADAEDEFASYKAALSEAVRQTLQNGLWILGIKAPQRL